MPDEARMNYPLGPNAVVLDAGVYQADFTNWCTERWKCSVIGFEPVPSFYEQALKALRDPSYVHLYKYGLGGSNRQEKLHIRADSSTVFFKKNVPEEDLCTIEIRDVARVFLDLALRRVDLFKINIEGGEYELIDRLVDTMLIYRVRYVQVQFHGGKLPGMGPTNADEERLRIRSRLAETHREQWCAGQGQWESWELR